MKTVSKIKIFINGEEKLVPPSKTIAELLLELKIESSKVAIEKDLQIVRRNDFSKIIVEENCKIEIVHFIGGG